MTRFTLSRTLQSTVAVFVLCAVGCGAAATAADPLGTYRWKSRVLVVSAPSTDDPKLREQRRLFAAMGREARERNLVIVEAVGEHGAAPSLRRRFAMPADRFQAVLVGKDGGEKLVSPTPLGPDRLLPTIDAMPMRREEMRRGR